MGSRSPIGLRGLQAVFVLSGACGLIYEAVWSHYLKLTLGHAAYAQTVVLVVYIGGMAIGAGLCGRFAGNISNPLRAYAVVEFAIGVAGIAFHGLFVRVADWAYATVLPAVCAQEGICIASWGLAAALVLPQSILLGSTFPLMVSGVVRATGTNAGRQVSLFYFLNSIGAVGGVLASTFVIVPWVGLPGATLSAGVANILLAIVSWEIAGRLPQHLPAPATAPAAPHSKGPSLDVSLLLLVSAVTGLSSFLYEVFWIRMLALVVGASTHAFELMLASFILGLALGGWWIRGRIDRAVEPWRFLGRVQVLMGLAAITTMPLYNYTFDFMALALRTLAHNYSGYVVYNAVCAGIAMAVMLPATFLAGMTLPLITLLLLRGRLGETSIGFVYSANALGAIGGVMLGVHVLMPLLGVRNGMLIAGGIDILLGILLLVCAARGGAGRAPDRVLVAATLGAIAFVGVGTAFDPHRLASGVFRRGVARLGSDAVFLFHRDGKTATIDVVRSASGVISIMTNGKADAAARSELNASAEALGETDEDTMTLLGALPLAFRPDARDIAVIGFGSGLSTATLLGSPRVRRVETIEIEPAVVEGASAFRPLVEAAYTDPRSHVILDDAKAHFARSGRRYDVIVSEPSNPWVSGVSSLFTEEFYRHARDRLLETGILVQWVHLYEFDTRLLASILRPLGAIFEDYVVYRSRGSDAVIVAAVNGVVGEPSARIFDDPALAERLRRVGIANPTALETRRASGRDLIDAYLSEIDVAANSDYFPIVDLDAARARFVGSSAEEVVMINDGPMPLVEMLERRPVRLEGALPDSPLAMPRHARVAAAEKWTTYLLAARPGEGEILRSRTMIEESVAVTRAVLVDCLSKESVDPLWDRLVILAAEFNQVLTRERAQSLWVTLAHGTCAGRLGHRYRSWLDLFAVVGARDARGMSRIAEELLAETTSSPLQREYLFNAAITGYVVERNFGAARDALHRAAKELPRESLERPWMRMQRVWVQSP